MYNPIDDYLDGIDREIESNDLWELFNNEMERLRPLGLTVRQFLTSGGKDDRPLLHGVQFQYIPFPEYLKYFCFGWTTTITQLLTELTTQLTHIHNEDDLEMKLFKTDLFTSLTGEMIPAGTDMVLTIDGARLEKLNNGRGEDEKPVITFVETKKFLVLNKTNARTLVALFGTDDTDVMAGKKIALYGVEVSAFGKITKAVRIRDKLPAPTAPAVARKSKANANA